MTPFMLRAHRWLGLVMGPLILVAATTAIGLNHQDALRSALGPPAVQGDPSGKRVKAIASDPLDATRLLLGTDDGLFRSRDGGSHWEEAVLPVPAEHVVSIVYDLVHPGRVYVALEAIGVYRSDDQGEVWEDVSLPFYPPEGTHVTGLTAGPHGQLVMTTTLGLFRQAASGGEWQPVRNDAGPSRPVSRDAATDWLYQLHDGRVWGSWGVPVTDAVSGALIVLVLSGYALFLGRAIRIRSARKRSPVP